MPDPNQPNNQNPQAANPVMPMGIDIPPMPKETSPASPFAATVATAPDPSAAGSGDSTPSDLPPIISTPPKKKFGGGRIIATILGLFLLVGGVGAGLVLTQQQQLFQQKAGGYCSNNSQCASGVCQNGVCGMCNANSCGTGYQCKGGECVPKDVGCSAGQSSCSGACVNLLNDNNNCGACGHVCTSGATCQSGACVPPPTVSCGVGDCAAVGGTTCEGDGGTCSGTKPNCSCTYPQTACSNEGGSCAGGKSCCTGLYCITSTKTCSKTGPGGGLGNVCGPNNPCAFGYSCSGDGTACLPNTNTNCKTGDLGAPVCCSTNGVSTAADCTAKGGTPACEPPARFECNVNGTFCTLEVNSSSCGGGTTPPGTTPPGPAAQCSAVTAYSASWAALTSTQLSDLKTGDIVNFCVTGTSTSTGGFDKAKFTINGTAEAETTTKGSGAAAGSFCQTYTIPAGTVSFNVSAQIHDSTLGWSQ